LIEKKGFETSLRAFATFRKKHPDAHFTIAGEGPMLPDLRTLTRELGLEDSVCFAGFLPQARLREAFYQSDIFVHPSELGPDGNQEGVPNSMLEAMASGLPVFATNHGGIPEAIDHGVSGVLVPERSHETLADELLEWTERPRDLQQLARMGARVVADKFEQRGQVRALEAIYDEALL
jgi:colanic acid/amylovoran biosynthesis glycosyltransferase